MRSDFPTLSSSPSIFGRIASRCRGAGWWAFYSQPWELWFCRYRPAPWHLRRRYHDYLCFKMLLTATALRLGLPNDFVEKVFDYGQRSPVWQKRLSCCDGWPMCDYSVIHLVLLRLQSVSKWQWYPITVCWLKAWHSECLYLSFHSSDLSVRGSKSMISVGVRRQDLEMCRQLPAAGRSWYSCPQRLTSSKAETCF